MNYINNPANDESQHGTQGLIFKYFKAHPPAHNILVDVGAFGKFLSNSYGLLKMGWKGLLIEANPERIPIIEKDFADCSVEVLNIGISNTTETRPFYLHKTAGYDSFSPDWRREDKTGTILPVLVFPLSTILHKRKMQLDFDLLTIDTEGLDEKIIIDLFNNSAYRPRLIVVEADSFSDAESLFAYNGYTLHAVAGGKMDGNLLFSRGS